MTSERALIGVVVTDAVALGALRSAPLDLLRRLPDLSGWLNTGDADRAVALTVAAVLWCVAAWVGLGLAAAAVARAPGFAGRIGARTVAVVLPKVLQRLIAGSAGMGVLLAPVVAQAAAAPDTGRPAVSASAVVQSPAYPVVGAPLPAPSWPLSAPTSPTAPTMPAPAWPVSARDVPVVAPPTRPSAHPASSGSAPADPRSGQVTVRPGDSLWLIAARRQGRPDAPADAHAIARAWPRWYAANRDVIGDDPALITPGQVLHAPAARHRKDPS